MKTLLEVIDDNLFIDQLIRVTVKVWTRTYTYSYLALAFRLQR